MSTIPASGRVRLISESSAQCGMVFADGFRRHSLIVIAVATKGNQVSTGYARTLYPGAVKSTIPRMCL